jgi:hypothetical protein
MLLPNMDHTMMMDMVHLCKRPYTDIILCFAPLLSGLMPPNQLELGVHRMGLQQKFLFWSLYVELNLAWKYPYFNGCLESFLK